MYNIQTVLTTCSYRLLTHTHVHIHIQMSSKNSHPGKRWIPATTGCKRGWGESWESWMPAWRATERAEGARAKADGAKKRQEQINTHPDLARIFQRLMSEIYLHSVVSQLAGHSGRHIGWGRLITVLLPAWHSLGKPRWEVNIGVSARSGSAYGSARYLDFQNVGVGWWWWWWWWYYGKSKARSYL